uniref:Peptidase S1 domain-containing protein n=1 Tax=Steinernema glaseri TaxID=37863 RepID=A0A1I8ASG3_9BILA
MGKVIPYERYSSNKENVDLVCPDLVTVYEYKKGAKQVFSPKDSVSGFVKKGPFMKAARTEGYCGAKTPLYRVDSKPAFNGRRKTVSISSYLDQILRASPNSKDSFQIPLVCPRLASKEFFADALYTTGWGEYDQVRRKNSWYKAPGGHDYGIQFYIWS